MADNSRPVGPVENYGVVSVSSETKYQLGRDAAGTLFFMGLKPHSPWLHYSKMPSGHRQKLLNKGIVMVNEESARLRAELLGKIEDMRRTTVFEADIVAAVEVRV